MLKDKYTIVSNVEAGIDVDAGVSIVFKEKFKKRTLHGTISDIYRIHNQWYILLTYCSVCVQRKTIPVRKIQSIEQGDLALRKKDMIQIKKMGV